MLGAERIGHGTSSAADPTLLAHLAEHRIPLEVCPSSNIATRAVASLEEHPLKAFVDAGVVVTINSDDPPMFNTTLNNEYEIAADLLGLDEHGITDLARAAVDRVVRAGGCEDRVARRNRENMWARTSCARSHPGRRTIPVGRTSVRKTPRPGQLILDRASPICSGVTDATRPRTLILCGASSFVSRETPHIGDWRGVSPTGSSGPPTGILRRCGSDRPAGTCRHSAGRTSGTGCGCSRPSRAHFNVGVEGGDQVGRAVQGAGDDDLLAR